VLPAERCTFATWNGQRPENGSHLQDAKEKIIEGQLLAFVGVPPKITVKKLAVEEGDLRKCVDASPIDFWQQKAPTRIYIREVTMHLFSAKATSISVERVWNVFGDNLSVKRRCMGKGMLVDLVYARMNMHLLPHDSLGELQQKDEQFLKMFETAAEIDEQEEAAAALAARTKFVNVMDSADSDANVAPGGTPEDSDDVSVGANHYL
jgi:hypothetical protein